ncbi:MAG: NUDIX domain-containing protein [Clostridiaceae bacterium]|nr:NUDIX domain-containing protein [Clostridiaceae bacterium]
MDLTVNLEDYLLNIRAAAIIVHNNKVLVHRNVNSDHYALLGGRVKIGEDSETTVIREILEEIGKKVEVTGYVATIENFFEMKNKKYHEILFVHKAEFEKEEDRKLEKTIKNAEGKEYLQYEWLEIDKLNNYNLLPNSIKNILQEGKFPIHKINNELN